MCVNHHVDRGVYIGTCNGVFIDPDSPIWDEPIESSEKLLRDALAMLPSLEDAESLEWKIQWFEKHRVVEAEPPEYHEKLIQRLERAEDNQFLDGHEKDVCKEMLAILRFREQVKKQKRSPSKSVRQRVIERDGGLCRYCGCEPDKIHIDHVVPYSLGGLTEESNLVVSCPQCNMKKRGMPLELSGLSLIGDSNV